MDEETETGIDAEPIELDDDLLADIQTTGLEEIDLDDIAAALEESELLSSLAKQESTAEGSSDNKKQRIRKPTLFRTKLELWATLEVEAIFDEITEFFSEQKDLSSAFDLLQEHVQNGV